MLSTSIILLSDYSIVYSHVSSAFQLFLFCCGIIWMINKSSNANYNIQLWSLILIQHQHLIFYTINFIFYYNFIPLHTTLSFIIWMQSILLPFNSNVTIRNKMMMMMMILNSAINNNTLVFIYFKSFHLLALLPSAISTIDNLLSHLTLIS